MVDREILEYALWLYFILVGVLGVSVLWSHWRCIMRAEEEYKTCVRELIDDAMKREEKRVWRDKHEREA